MKRFHTLSICAILGAIPFVSFASERDMHTKVPFESLTLQDLERFHGHVGPYVALGARMGEHAVIVHKIPRYFGLHVQVQCPKSPPPSCIIDGLQQATGATMGKKNIVHIPVDSGVKVTIQDKEDNRQVIYTIKPEVYSLLKRWEDEGLGVEERGKRIFEMKAEDLFKVQVGKMTKANS